MFIIYYEVANVVASRSDLQLISHQRYVAVLERGMLPFAPTAVRDVDLHL